MQIAKVGPFLKNSGNLLHDIHKNFENWFRNSWDNWGLSWQPSFRNWHFAITQRQKNNFHVKGNFDLNYLSYFYIDFQNSCDYHVSSFLNFSKKAQLLQFAWVEADKRASNQVGTVLLDTLYLSSPGAPFVPWCPVCQGARVNKYNYWYDLRFL